jgi:small subunit ribosomal protein S17
MSENTNQERGNRKQRVGIVTSDKMDKTAVVTVNRKARHAKFKKVINISKKYYAHDEKNEAKIGDQVVIAETRPTSKKKCWRLMSIQSTAE